MGPPAGLVALSPKHFPAGFAPVLSPGEFFFAEPVLITAHLLFLKKMHSLSACSFPRLFWGF